MSEGKTLVVADATYRQVKDPSDHPGCRYCAFGKTEWGKRACRMPVEVKQAEQAQGLDCIGDNAHYVAAV